jgi:hypothetical protein
MYRINSGGREVKAAKHEKKAGVPV